MTKSNHDMQKANVLAPIPAVAAELALPGRRRNGFFGVEKLQKASTLERVGYSKQGPRNRLCRAAGAAASSGGSALREAKSVEANFV